VFLLLDPREELPPIMLKSDVLSINDIKTGIKLTGTVRNVVDFGAFVDIGIKNDGLCHISHCADKFIKHPLEVLKIGDILEFTVISVDLAKGRVSLSLKRDPFAESARGTEKRSHDSSPREKKPKNADDIARNYENRMKDNFSSVEIKFTKLK